MLDFITKKIHI